MNARSSHKENSSGGTSPEIKVERGAIQHLTPLRTKLCVPPLQSSWITRSRLVKRMDEGSERKLTLISAPAGFGKTTLLVDWVHKHKKSVAWFSVDKGDNDPLHFLTYVILGLQSLEDGTGKAALTMLQSPQPPPIESVLITLINDVIRIPTDLSLIFDDYHLVDTTPIHDLMGFLLENLPDETIDSNPKLCIVYARELFKSGYLDDAEKRLQTAEQILDTTSIGDSNKENLQGRIAVIRAYMSSRTGDVSLIIHFANQALKLLPERDLIWRSVAATTLGFAYGWAGAGDLIKAQQAFSEAMKISEAAGNIYYNIFAGSCLGAVMLMRGKVREAKDISQQSLNLAIKNGIEQTGIVGSLYSNLGIILCEWADFDEGIRLINKGIDLSEQGRDPVILGSCRISLLRALIYRMDIAGAFKVIEELNESVRNFMLPPWITNTTSAFNVLFWLAAGDLNKALQWVKERGLSIEDKLENLRGIEYIALTNILIAQNQLDDAVRFSQCLLEMAQAGDNAHMQIEIRLLRSSIFKALVDKSAALGELKSALELGEPGGFLMTFVSKGKPVADLLEEVVEVKKCEHDDTKAGFSLPYAKKILSVFKAGTPPKIDGLLDPISERELEVLFLIAAGLSNREIAEKLFISLNTVKTHTKNINSKLDVNSRIKAVARAKEMGLL